MKRTNYSYVDAGSFAFDTKRGHQEALEARSRAGAGYRNTSPKDVLIDYIRYILPGLQHGPSYIPDSFNKVYDRFCRAYMRWLTIRGWDLEDVMTWAWILSSESSERAALRLEIAGRGKQDEVPRCQTIPQFILVFLLRRQNMTAIGFQRILEFTWRYMDSLMYTRRTSDDYAMKSSRIPNPKNDTVGMYEFMFMLIIIRLLRSARSLWPAACPSVAKLFCQYMDGVHFQEQINSDPPSSTTNHAALAFMYNKVLKLCGLPCKINPVESAIYQQEAQFAILRRMSQFKPPLIVDRQGYRAVASMQLLHSKTDDEKQWAALKSKSWPPWIQERSGLDADLEWEDGVSRAQDVLFGARTAGYAADGWDDVAQVLAGWDTDGSPTIQSRVILQPINRRSVKKGSESSNVDLWAARIQATRTLEEAWSAFLNWRSQRISSTGSQFVYQAMFEKLFRKESSLLQGDRGLLEEDEEYDSYPGDTLAVFPAPSPPDTGIYLHKPPPSVEELSRQMLEDDKVKPNGSLLHLLLSKSKNVASAKAYLKAAGFGRKFILALLYQPHEPRGEFDNHYVVRDVSKGIVSALARAFIHMSESALLPKDSGGKSRRPLVDTKLLTHARALLQLSQTRERVPWYSLISAYTVPQAPDASLDMAHSHVNAVVMGWREVCKIAHTLEQFGTKFDVEGFSRLSRSLLRAIRKAAGSICYHHGYIKIPYRFCDDIDLVLVSGPRLLKKVFFEVFQPLPGPEEEKDWESKPDPYGPLDQLLNIPDIASSSPPSSNVLDHTATSSNNNNTTPSATSPSSDNSDPNVDTTDSENRLQLPKLLETPRFKDLHGYVAVLGLLRHWRDLVGLVEWMSRHADAIGEWSAQWNQHRVDRHCIVALRVYSERSWRQHPNGHPHLDWVGCSDDQDEAARLAVAPDHVRERIRSLVEEKAHVWGQWPTEQEVKAYSLKYQLLQEVELQDLTGWAEQSADSSSSSSSSASATVQVEDALAKILGHGGL